MKDTSDKTPHATNKRRMRAKLIFNPSAGAAESPVELMDVIREMQAWKLVPEAYLVEPGCDLSVVVQNALAAGEPHVRGMRRRWHHSGRGRILDSHTRHPGDHPHRHAEQHGPQPGYSDGYSGRHRDPPHGPAHQGGHGHGRLRQNGAALPPGLCGGAGFGCFPVGRRYPHGNLARIGDFLAALVASPPARCTWYWTTSKRSTLRVTWR